MKQECQPEEQITGAFEWMRERGSKKSGTVEHFYKGVQYNEEAIRSAEEKCSSRKERQDANEGRYFFLKKVKTPEEGKRKQGSEDTRQKAEKKCASIWSKISEAATEAGKAAEEKGSKCIKKDKMGKRKLGSAEKKEGGEADARGKEKDLCKESKPEGRKTPILLDEAIKEDRRATFFASNVMSVSTKAKQYMYNLQDEVAAFSEHTHTHLSKKGTLAMLKQMRQGKKWSTVAACRSKKLDRKGLSAGIAISTRKDVKAMLPDCDHEGITGNSRFISAILKAESEVVLIHVYGHVGMGITDVDFEMPLEVAAATDGGRRIVIAMGDFNMKAEELEASGILRSLGLTLIRLENSTNTCTCGRGSCIDYALVTLGYTDAIVDIKAVKAAPWGPHDGLRIKFRTNIKSMFVPEIVRPRPVEEAVKELAKLDLIEPDEEEIPRISWAESKRTTRKSVETAMKRKQPEVQEYVENIGIAKSMAKTTWQYAQWSAAAELRMLSAKGVKVKSLTQKQVEANCGRGLPWAVKHQPIECKKKEDYIEEQAWHVKAKEAFSGDLLGMIAETLVLMMQRRSKGRVLDEQRQRFREKDPRRKRLQKRHGRDNGQSSSTQGKERGKGWEIKDAKKDQKN